MRNITLEEIVKTITVLLVLFPVVDLVDQSQNGMKEIHSLHQPTQPEKLLILNNNQNQTVIRSSEEAVGMKRTISGNWDSLSPTRSDMVIPSASASAATARNSFGLDIFPHSSFAPSVSSSMEGSYVKISSSSKTITEHHTHALESISMPTLTTSNSGGGNSASSGVIKAVNNKKRSSFNLPSSSFAVEPPLPLASSTRVTGPFFESNKTTIQVTAKAGQPVVLDCSVILLQGRTVSWLKRVGKDGLELLTYGNTSYAGDSSRLGLRFRYPNNWRLGIDPVTKRDEGEYLCQLSTHPPKELIYHLKVIAPSVQVLDENGHAVTTERHYKVDSSLHLTCRASHVDKFVDKVMWLKGNRPLPGGDNRIKVKFTKNPETGESTTKLSVLSVRTGDSGNYTCRVSSLAKSTITVHVLNGEFRAAVQHNSSALLHPERGRLVTVLLLLGLMSAVAVSREFPASPICPLILCQPLYYQ